jgi:hypothetical protein
MFSCVDDACDIRDGDASLSDVGSCELFVRLDKLELIKLSIPMTIFLMYEGGMSKTAL